MARKCEEYVTCDARLTAAFLGPWLEPGKPDDELEAQVYSIVDVRDLVAALVTLLHIEAPADRYILSAEPLFNNDFALVSVWKNPADHRQLQDMLR